MRIAFYLESTENTGGVNRVVSIIASELAGRGYEVHVISRYEGKSSLYEMDKNVVLHELYPHFVSKYKSFYGEYSRLKKIIHGNKIDILVSAGATFFMIACWIKGVRHFEWDHVSFWHGNYILRLCRRMAAKKAEKVIVLTEDNRKMFEAIKGKAKVITLYNPSSFIAEKRVDVHNQIVIAVGYIGEQKGFDLLLQAWKRLPSFLRKSWELWIVGKDEGQQDQLEDYMTRNQLENISFLGYRQDVAKLMGEASIYAMSSRWEGLPMVLIEAQTIGLPIVAFDCKTGPRDIVTPDSGILVKPGDIRAYSEALRYMMEHEQFRQACKEKAMMSSERFNRSVIIDQWESILNN